MKTIVALLAVLVSFNVQAWTQRDPQPVQTCQVHAPYGFLTTTKKLTPICRQGYLVAYDAANKIPNNVAWTLEPAKALGCIPRTNAFVSDQSIQNGPVPEDYAGTGYDKGHAAPDGDLSWDQQVEYESFLMTNMFPQAGSLNRGIWKLLETATRGWSVQQNANFTIISGAIYSDADKTIGKGVRVPHSYYKIVINQKTKEIAGWQFPHVAPYPNLGNDLKSFRKPVAQIQAEAGVAYKYPAGAIELQPGKEWWVDYGALTNAKRAKCGRAQ